MKHLTHKELYYAYEKLCTEFFQANIDGVTIDGFVNDKGDLLKYNSKTKIFGKFLKNGKVASIYKITDDEWKLLKKQTLKGVNK